MFNSYPELSVIRIDGQGYQVKFYIFNKLRYTHVTLFEKNKTKKS